MRPAILASLLLLAACDGGVPPDDAGPRDAEPSMDTGPATACTSDRECEDALFCTTHRCLPGNPSADPRGCVLDDGPCEAGEVCDEGARVCTMEACGAVPDADDDGFDSIACGGGDCDDDDRLRHPGAAEVCDPMGHDEDCDPETYAGDADGDVDGDGFVSALCCNGVDCGDDCDDGDRAVFPGARELCNGRDDDCDGASDEEPAGADPLCPGGTCRAGRCDLDGWDRTFGGPDGDLTSSVTMDDVGRVYVAGWFQGTARFGGPAVTSASPDQPDIFVVAYEPDGAFAWSRRFGGSGADVAIDIAYDPVSAQLYVAGTSYADIDLGGGVRAAGTDGISYVFALDRAGSYRWDHVLPVFPLMALDAHDGVAINTVFTSPHDFGGGTRTPRGDDTVVLRLGTGGEYRWDVHVRAPAGGAVMPARISLDDAGLVSVAGLYSGGSVDFGGGARVNRGSRDIFALRLDAAGAYVWDYTAGGTGYDFAAGLRSAPDGTSYIVGGFEGTVDFGSGPVTAPARSSAFAVQLTPDGSTSGVQTWGGMGDDNAARGLAVDSAGNLHVVGTFSGAVNFGGGARVAPAVGAGFHVVFDPRLNYRSDTMYAYVGADAGLPCPASDGTSCAVNVFDIAIGPADSTAITGYFGFSVDLGDGTRRSEGEDDGFVRRLGS